MRLPEKYYHPDPAICENPSHGGPEVEQRQNILETVRRPVTQPKLTKSTHAVDFSMETQTTFDDASAQSIDVKIEGAPKTGYYVVNDVDTETQNVTDAVSAQTSSVGVEEANLEIYHFLAKTGFEGTLGAYFYALVCKPELQAISMQDMNCNKEPIEELELDEKVIQVDTFIEYEPQKLRSGLPHPDSVVETASLSSISSPPIVYQMHIPEEIVDFGKISTLQLEAALYACQAHEKLLPSGERVGYFIGDGAGVGKGRTIATIIYENYLLGRKKAIWISASADLFYDAKRDLQDIGANIKVHSFSKMSYADVDSAENGKFKRGVLFLTYTALIGSQTKKGEDGKVATRLDQLIKWCGEEFDGPVIFDESHQAKNLVTTGSTKPTKTGKCVLELQQRLPKARIIYASATGASEPRNMAYMVRLGLWGEGQAFPNFETFIKAVENKGIGTIELIAIDMKLRGLYIARQLSFEGVTFNIKEVISDLDFVKLYDRCVKLFIIIKQCFEYAIKQTNRNDGAKYRTWAHFWSAHQRFFRCLCIAAKVSECVAIAKKALKDGKCVVIGLQSTGDCHVKSALSSVGKINGFVSSAKIILKSLVENHFPSDDQFADSYSNFEVNYTPDGKRVYLTGKKARRLLMKGPANKRHSDQSSSIQENDDSQSEDESVNELVNESEGELEDEHALDKMDEDYNSTDFSDSEEDDTQNADLDANDNRKSEVEVNPFLHDFSSGVDPWAHLQTFEDSSSSLERKKRDRIEKKRQKMILRQGKQKRLGGQENRQNEIKLNERRVYNSMLSPASEVVSSVKCLMENNKNSILSQIKAELLNEIERIEFPPNALDLLIHELGGPDCVAEMTGRKSRIVMHSDGQFVYEPRNANSEASVDNMNLEEKENFMSGKKLIAIISEAASAGISLQSDKRAKNTRRRSHITLELPWSAIKAVQQFGRTHRSNQMHPPEYLFLISELAGEKRFASTVAKRLERLGALTHGDRRAAETRDLSQFNLDTTYGRSALQNLTSVLTDPKATPIIPPPIDYPLGSENFFDDMRQYLVAVDVLRENKSESNRYTCEKSATLLPKFLNRLLGLPVHAQNALFSYFTDITNDLIKTAKLEGTYDKGIMDLGNSGERVENRGTREFRGLNGNPNFIVRVHKISAELGFEWNLAKELYSKQVDVGCGFFLSKPKPNQNRTIVLVIKSGTKAGQNYVIIRPNTGRLPKKYSFVQIAEKFDKIPIDKAENEWKLQHEMLSKMCLHRYTYGHCKQEDQSKELCEFGRSYRYYVVLTGSVIAIWPKLEEALSDNRIKRRLSHMQIVRVRTIDDQKLVGLHVPRAHVSPVTSALNKMCKGSI